MKRFDQFILEIPYLFLKKIPYAWLAAVVFWNSHPLISVILLAIVLLGLGMMAWQERAWRARIRREFHRGEAKPYIDHPHASWGFRLRNLALVLAASALLGWLLNGRFGLDGLQWACLLAGVMLLYKDAYLFGASTTYMITDQGVGIRIVPGGIDYRLFFRFHEIRRAERTKMPDRFPRQWEMLVPMRYPKEGVLMHSVRPEGFSKRIQSEVFLAPTDIDAFLKVMGENSRIV